MNTRLTENQRLRIQYLKSQGHSNLSIASTIKCSPRTVRRWANKAFGDIQENKRSGRKSKISNRTKQRIIREVLHNKTSLSKLAQKYNLSKSSIHRIIRNYSPKDPIKPYKLKLVPRLTDRQKQLR